MAKFQNLFTGAMFIISTLLVHAMGDIAWEDGSATFYGDMKGGETMSKLVKYFVHALVTSHNMAESIIPYAYYERHA